MNSKVNRNTTQENRLNSNKLNILIEIVVVFLPMYFGLVISDRNITSHIPLWSDIVLLGGPITYLSLVLSLFLLWYFSRKRGATWGSYGVKRPKNWFRIVLMSLGIALAILLTVKLIINPIMNAMPNAGYQDLSRFDYLEGDLPNLIVMLVNIWITAAFLEEFMFRGYLMDRLMALQNQQAKYAWVIAAVGQAIIFGLMHSYQGPIGMFKVGMIGLVFGVAYLITGRNLWPLVLAHGLIDSLDMIGHYFGG